MIMYIFLGIVLVMVAKVYVAPMVMKRVAWYMFKRKMKRHGRLNRVFSLTDSDNFL